MNKKEFMLEQLKEYVQNPLLCGYYGGKCMNITPEGKMCVAGKNLLPSVRREYPKANIDTILRNSSQENIFISSSVGILTTSEWESLQIIHDRIAECFLTKEYFEALFNDSSLPFTYNELMALKN